jgi:proteic killer suppression protein
MEVEIDDKEILKLYETGKSKKIRLPKDAIEKFFLRINLLFAAKDIYDLWKDPAAKFEKLSGENRYSMRLNIKYRIELEVDWENKEHTIGIFKIVDINTHYE